MNRSPADPGELLPDEDFDAIKDYLDKTYQIEATEQDMLSYALYPKVFDDYQKGASDRGKFQIYGK